MKLLKTRRFRILTGALAVVVAVILIIEFGFPVIDTSQNISAQECGGEGVNSDAKSRLEPALNRLGYVDEFPSKICMLALKEERKLLVYAADMKGTQLIKSYPFTAFSGQLGPKLKEGDKQIPEGVYQVEYLNPNSRYHLSMKINYPNAFDKSKTTFSDYAEMGGDIFIHGKAVTIGCIPIGDEAIEEVYLLTQHALGNGVSVIISPWDFRVNSSYPVIDGIDWERELYDSLVDVLREIPQ